MLPNTLPQPGRPPTTENVSGTNVQRVAVENLFAPVAWMAFAVRRLSCQACHLPGGPGPAPLSSSLGLQEAQALAQPKVLPRFSPCAGVMRPDVLAAAVVGRRWRRLGVNGRAGQVWRKGSNIWCPVYSVELHQLGERGIRVSKSAL